MKIVAIEGIDGSGKDTQAQLLKSGLESLGLKVVLRSYPVYESFLGTQIGEFLSAKTSTETAATVDPKSMALWYAVDRWRDISSLKSRLSGVDVLILNRYTLSSIVYQSLRPGAQEGIGGWIDDLEHGILELPKPDVYLIMGIGLGASQSNIKKKGARDYIGAGMDIYEADEGLQAAARKMYMQVASTRTDCELIDCGDSQGHLLSPEIIAKMIQEALAGRGIISHAI